MPVEPETAMDLVDSFIRGEIPRESFIEQLTNWDYDPRPTTGGLAGDYIETRNSLDAVDDAYYASQVITDEEYDAIMAVQAARTPARGRDPGRD